MNSSDVTIRTAAVRTVVRADAGCPPTVGTRSRRSLRRLLVRGGTLLFAAGCASSGAGSPSYDWSDFLGSYRFESRLRGGDELRGSFTLHSPEIYTLSYEVTGRGGRACRQVQNQDRSNEVWAELQGNRLLLSCWGVLFRIWHAGESLDGTARFVSGDRGNLRFERVSPEY